MKLMIIFINKQTRDSEEPEGDSKDDSGEESF